MDFIPVPNTIRVDFIYSWGGQTCYNTLHLEKATAVTLSDLQSVVTVAADLWEQELAPQHGDTVTLVQTRATDLTSQNAPGVDNVLTPPISGAIQGELCPNNVTLAFSLLTGLRGRSYRGRWYFVGIPVAQVDDNIVSTNYADSTILALANIISTFEQSNLTPVVVSRFHNKAPRAIGVTTPIISVNTDYVVDSQRRRLPKRGK